MGRRSRKRADGPLSAPASAAPPKPRPESKARMGRMDRMIARADERPKPPWHPFPLVELSVLIGIVMIVYGFIDADTPRGRVALVVGMALCSLAGLDTAVREHFEGYRSHTLLLSGLFAVVTAAALFFAKAPWIAIAITAVLVFAAGFALFRRAFRRRAGVSFKT
jgi:hypothetical protein